MPSPLLLPLLTASAVLLISGAAKVRDPSGVDQAFTSMHVPAALDRPFVRRLLPWAEIVLGVVLLLVSGAALALAGVLTLGLFLAYLVLVVLAVRRPEPADCGCFGAVGDSEVTMATVWRNVLLVLTAALVVVAGLRDVSVIGTGLEGSAWGWVAASVLTTAVAVLVVWRPTDIHASTAATAQPELDEDGDFVATRAPRTAVLDEHGAPVLLDSEVVSSAHLLVFVQPYCGSCAVVRPMIPAWDDQLGPVTVRAVVNGLPTLIDGLDQLRGRAWFDPFGLTREAFGAGAPSAVLVGTDGMIAGGPVHGSDAVVEFVGDIKEHLREAGVLNPEGERELLVGELVSDDR